MIDLSLPWAIGPVPLGLTMAAAYGVFIAFVRREGLTGVSIVSALGLVSGVAALVVHLWRPSVDRMTILLTAQVVCTGVILLLCWLLWVARKPGEKAREPAWNTASNRANDPKIIKGLLACLAPPVFIDVLLYVFPHDAGLLRQTRLSQRLWQRL